MGIRLIATDLDGTLIGRANEFELYDRFRNAVDQLRADGNGYWAVCTGRSLRSFGRFFEPLAAMDASPDFVIVRHAYIYGARRSGFAPHRLWNLRTRLLIRGDLRRQRQVLRKWENAVRRRFRRVRVAARQTDRLCLRLDSDDSAEAAAAMFSAYEAECRHLRVFRYSREVDVRSVPFTKGLAVSELARHLGIDRSEILAVGDGHNDISMLDGGAAVMTGCPANAEPEVAEVVHRSGGHIAEGRALSGVIEVIAAHRNGEVRSALPPTWRNPVNGSNPRNQRRHTSELHRRRRIMRTTLLAGTAVATVLALASLDLLPFSRLIMAPFELLARVLAGALGRVYR